MSTYKIIFINSIGIGLNQKYQEQVLILARSKSYESVCRVPGKTASLGIIENQFPKQMVHLPDLHFTEGVCPFSPMSSSLISKQRIYICMKEYNIDTKLHNVSLNM